MVSRKSLPGLPSHVTLGFQGALSSLGALCLEEICPDSPASNLASTLSTS